MFLVNLVVLVGKLYVWAKKLAVVVFVCLDSVRLNGMDFVDS